MGGCYESERYSRPAVNTAQVNFNASLKKFFASGERSDLISAYTQMLKDGSAKGFIKKIHDYAKISTAPKEFNWHELEAKFSINLIPIDARPGKSPSLDELMDAFDFQPTQGSRFLKDPVNAISTGVNHFYGTADGEERLVIITKGGETFKKEKGNVEPFNYKIPGERYILKRSETRVPTNPDEIAEAMLRLNKDGKLKDIGAIEKTKGDFFLINTLSGREYGCTVSHALLLPEKKKSQLQLEIEYAGYTPGFPAIKVNKEEDIVREMAQLLTSLMLSYGMAPVQVNKNYSMTIKPTLERNFDFASGKELAKEPDAIEQLGVKQKLLVM